MIIKSTKRSNKNSFELKQYIGSYLQYDTYVLKNVRTFDFYWSNLLKWSKSRPTLCPVSCLDQTRISEKSESAGLNCWFTLFLIYFKPMFDSTNQKKHSIFSGKGLVVIAGQVDDNHRRAPSPNNGCFDSIMLCSKSSNYLGISSS